MTLGERICAQRTARGMSQAELAERLEVSRQSVSKWETDASTPDLDKLVKLCGIFELTLDQLVREQEPEPVPPPAQTVIVKGTSPRILAGGILLACGALVLCILLILGRGDPRAALVLASPFAVCGGICLAVKRHAGLLCGWVLLGMACWFWDEAVGIRPWWVLSPWLYRSFPNMGVHLVIAWGQMLTLLALVLSTVRLFWRRWRKRKGEKKKV